MKQLNWTRSCIFCWNWDALRFPGWTKMYIKEKRKQVAKLSNPRMTKPSYPFPTGCNGWGSGCDPSHGHMDTILGRGRGPSLDWNSWVADIYMFLIWYIYIWNIYTYIYFLNIKSIYTRNLFIDLDLYNMVYIYKLMKANVPQVCLVKFTSLQFISLWSFSQFVFGIKECHKWANILE